MISKEQSFCIKKCSFLNSVSKCYPLIYQKLGFFFLLSLFFFGNLKAQNAAVDVTHYVFKISVNDSNNVIKGDAEITFKMRQASDSVWFDLTGPNDSTGKGMMVTKISYDNHDIRFTQRADRLYTYFDHRVEADSVISINIVYGGIPSDGLIISRNKFNDRTFFADNWPERAHDWIPCDDRPSDKATVDFVVIAPDHYQVISNGIRVESVNLPGNRKLTHWKEERQLPTKVMVIGVAPFAVQRVGEVDNIPIWTWVFPENKDSGFIQYAVSKKILPFYINYIGPYPFRKLANVQSKTIFGGMENASNIFYYENSVRDSSGFPDDYEPLEPLFAHETAHQWFGDDVTETNWPHLWLSEGFATYMTHMYMEYTYGEDTLRKRLEIDRAKVIAFSKKHSMPVVDTTHRISPMRLLNANSYQKGGWVLHMLRRKLGDDVFRKGIRLYYTTYKGRNASTTDFMYVMEKVSGEDLSVFFKQWLFTPGQPDLDVRWRFDPVKNKIDMSITQNQNYIFIFPLQIGIIIHGQPSLKTIQVSQKNTKISFDVPGFPDNVTLDPDVNLLFSGKISKVK
jgi:aminopeptidase N